MKAVKVYLLFEKQLPWYIDAAYQHTRLCYVQYCMLSLWLPTSKSFSFPHCSCLWTAGQLCVTRSHPAQPRPYTGVVSIVSGEIAEDIATYLVGTQCTHKFTQAPAWRAMSLQCSLKVRWWGRNDST